jgi:hypothetical protein
MKAYLPYVYSMTYIPRKRVRPLLAYGGGTVAVDVPEISLKETSLAASLEYAPPFGETIGQRCEFRTWNGAILVRVADDSYPVFKTSWLPSFPGEKSERQYAFKTLYGFTMFDGDRVERYAGGDINRAVTHHEPPAGEIVVSDEDQEIGVVSRLAANLVSVDGELWRKTGYVAFCLDTRPPNREDESLWASLVQRPFGYFPFTKETEKDRRNFPAFRKLFDITQQERLLHHAGTVGADWRFRSLVVHDVDALSFDGEREFILHCMDYTVLRVESTIGAMSAPAVTAWMNMRAAVERVRSAQAENFTDEEIDSFRLLAQEFEGEHSDLVREALVACEEYLNDPWGRYSSGTNPARKGQTPPLIEPIPPRPFGRG